MGFVLEVVIMVICSEILIALMVVKPPPSFIRGIDLVNGSASHKSKAYYSNDVNYRDDEVLCYLCSCGNPISALINRSLNKNTQLPNSILLPEFKSKEYLCENFARIVNYQVVNYELVKFCKMCELNIYDPKSVTILNKPHKYIKSLLHNVINFSKRKYIDRLLFFKYLNALKQTKSNSTALFSYLYAINNFYEFEYNDKITLKVFPLYRKQDESIFHYKKRFRNSKENRNSFSPKSLKKVTDFPQKVTDSPKKVTDYSEFNFSSEKIIKENVSETYFEKAYGNDNKKTKNINIKNNKQGHDSDSFKVYKDINLLNLFKYSIYPYKNKSSQSKHQRLNPLKRAKRNYSLNDEFKTFEQRKYNKNPFVSRVEKSFRKHRSKVSSVNGQNALVSNKSRSCSKCVSLKSSVMRMKGLRKFEKRALKTVSHISEGKQNANRKERKKRRAPVRNVKVIVGETANLPCDVRPRDADDLPQLVMWLKDGIHTPLFSVDFREGSSDRPQIWRDTSSSLAQRAVLHLSPSSSSHTRLNYESDRRKSSSRKDYLDNINSITKSGHSRWGHRKEVKNPEMEYEDSGEFEIEESGNEIIKAGALEVADVRFTDNGVYRCRIDFLHSPTKNARVNLNVIVPPKSVEIFYEEGGKEWKKIEGSVLGPLLEGESPSLKCSTLLTWPPSRVLWIGNDSVIDTSYETLESTGRNSSSKHKNFSKRTRRRSKKPHWIEEPNLLDSEQGFDHHKRNTLKSNPNVNHLSSLIDISKSDFDGKFELSKGVNVIDIKGVQRRDHSRKVTCVAANSNLTKPAMKTLTIKLALPVLAVQLDSVPPLRAGDVTEVQCTVWGSHPPPKISWLLGGYPITASHLWVSEDGNVTVSVVSLTPSANQDGETLSCTAFNPFLKGSQESSSKSALSRGISDSVKIEVQYAPKVRAWLGKSLDRSRIKEGDDVYFECDSKAKPKAHSIAWTHQGKELEEGSGILISNMTLVLQKVNRSQAGKYVCKATNAIGTSFSEPETLDVKFAPVCFSKDVKSHSVAKHENAMIACDVFANPTDVSFTWTFNNTAEVVNVPQDRYVVEGLGSVVNYTPMTELDYGTLLCWAQNEIGKQIVPCVFQILAAGKPDPPHNCRLHEVTLSSLQVTCLPGDNGGDNQNFLLQVMETVVGGDVVAEVTRPTPNFSVANLKPSTSYRLIVTATNRRGESKPAHLTVRTAYLHPPRHETSAEPTRGRESANEIASGVILGAILACVPVLLGILLLLIRSCIASKRRRRNAQALTRTEMLSKENSQQDCQSSTPDSVHKNVGGKDEDEEESQRLLQGSESSPLRGASSLHCGTDLIIKPNLNDMQNISFTSKAPVEEPLPPPLEYNQGYSPTPKTVQLGALDRECSCSLTRINSPGSMVGTTPQSVDDNADRHWNSQRINQLASCGYTLPRQSTVGGSYVPNLSYVNKSIKDRVFNPILPEFNASNSSVSTQGTSIGESSPDINRIQPVPVINRHIQPCSASVVTLEGERTGSDVRFQKPPCVTVVKIQTQNPRGRSVSFSDDAKTESSV